MCGSQAEQHRDAVYVTVGRGHYQCQLSPRSRDELTLIMHRANGDVERIPVLCRLDTAEEVSVYSAGGILQKFANEFMAEAG